MALRDRIFFIGVLLLMATEASRTAAFGVPWPASPLDCYYEVRRYDDISPFRSGNTTAIYLGNSKSCIAGYGGRPAPDTTYQFCIPSWVAFTDNGTLAGEAALNHAAISPGTAVSGIKRVIGAWLQDEVVRREMELVQYKFVKRLGRCNIQIETEKGGNAKDFLPEEVAGFLMSKLKHMAEAQLGREIRYAVVAVPGHFNDAQRGYATAGADSQHGGFRAAKVVDEPVAAAAAHGLHNATAGKVILVFHLGGRTAHATKFTFQDGVVARLLGARHDAYLGGDDFTGNVVDYFVELIREKHHRDIGRDESALRKLRAACESAKKALSDREDTLVNVESLLEDGEDFTEHLTRAKFEELNHHLLARAMDMVDLVVARGRNKDTVDEIILVGGSVRIPKVAQLFKDYFHGKDPIIDPEAVIRGAALLSRPEHAKYVSECNDY